MRLPVHTAGRVATAEEMYHGGSTQKYGLLRMTRIPRAAKMLRGRERSDRVGINNTVRHRNPRQSISNQKNRRINALQQANQHKTKSLRALSRCPNAHSRQRIISPQPAYLLSAEPIDQLHHLLHLVQRNNRADRYTQFLIGQSLCNGQ